MVYRSSLISAAAILISLAGLDVVHGDGVSAATPGVEAYLSSGGADAAAAGRVLLGELGCVHCHKVDDAQAAWLTPKQAPILEDVGQRITPQYLNDFITDPQMIKPGTTMPHALHGVPVAKRGEVAEVLTHFLASQGGPLLSDSSTFTGAQVAQGEKLFHTIGCVACHEPREPASKFEIVQSEQPDAFEDADDTARPDAASERGGRAFVALPDLGRKTTHNQLTKFLLDPLKHRPSGRMPSLNLSPTEALAIAAYLLKDQLEAAEESGQVVSKVGLSRKYYEPQQINAGNFNLAGMQAIRIDSVTKFSSQGANRGGNFAFRFEGQIKIPAGGEYTFTARSDDASFLYINGKEVVNNGGTHPPQDRSGKIKLEAGFHSIVVDFYQAGGGHELSIYWEGPGIKRQEVPEDVLYQRIVDVKPLGMTDFIIDKEKAGAGASYFQSLGCVNCHGEVGHAKSTPGSAPTLAKISPSKGCLADNPPADAPEFSLSKDQRAAIIASLKDASTWNKPPTAQQRNVHDMTALNCFACHQREDIGGPSDDGNAYFMPLVEADMGEEGRMPPALDGVGGKLTTAWLKQVLHEGTKIRPYMATRMPKFGEANVHGLVESLPKADATAQPKKAPDFEKKFVEAGHEFVGTGGMGCVNCHTFAGKPSLGIPGPDLAEMTKHLRYDWFVRWMKDPGKFRTGSRMPTYWPDGVSAFPNVLDGDADKQIAALWQYLSLGSSARTPAGIVLDGQALELVVSDRPIVFRTFFQGAGPRAITVGYPDRLNIAIDPELGQITRTWKGRFITGQGAWVGRAGGLENPLGGDVISLDGVPFAPLASDEEKWPPQPPNLRGDDDVHGVRMLRYTLDQDGYPQFAFRYGDGASSIEVTERPSTDLQATGVVLVRKFSAKVNADGWYHRIAAGQDVEQLEDGSYLVDKNLIVQIQTKSKIVPYVRTSNNKKELMVKLHEGSDVQWTEVISW